MRHPRFPRLAPVVLLLVLPFAGGASSQQSDPSTGGFYAQEQPAPGGPGVAEGTSSGLPVQAPPPRTLRAHWHVYIAFSLAWLLVFGYVISLSRRFGALDREIRRLEG